MNPRRFGTVVFLALAVAASGCSKKAGEKKLVLYSAGDSIFTKEIIDEFKKETGIEVSIASDTELTRGVALRIKIEKEKEEPRADVFWNNELVNTILLKKRGLLAQYKSPSAEDIPGGWKDSQGYWSAFGARARVFIVNTDRVKSDEMPKSYEDMLLPKWKGKVGMSKPTGGTTATQAAALFELWGEEKAKKFYTDLMGNGIVLCQGNAHVKDQVASGELYWGWTDTNDANVALRDGKPVKVVYPDQGEGQIGTLLIPHSVSMIKNCPHSGNAKKFIDFLLSKDTEKRLAHGISVQIPVRKGVEWPAESEKNFIMDIAKIKTFNDKIDWSKVADRLVETTKYMNEHFVK